MDANAVLKVAAELREYEGDPFGTAKHRLNEFADRLVSAAQSAAVDHDAWVEYSADVARLTREADIALHGEDNAARQASLCDIVACLRDSALALGEPITEALKPVLANILRGQTESAARGGGEAVAWMTDDGRVISATQKASAERDGGASRSSVAPYSIPLYATPPAPAVPGGSFEYGWVLEKGPPSAPFYLTVNVCGFDWTATASKALRLARREDADLLASIAEEAERVVEHGWASGHLAAETAEVQK